MKSPRDQFRESQYAKGFQDLVDSSQVQAAIVAATLELQTRFAKTCDLQEAGANEFRRQGAAAVLDIFRCLGIGEAPAKPASRSNLNPKA